MEEQAVGGTSSQARDLRKAAFTFVVVIGIVSLFADATYEGARSIVGPYMLLLGASGTIVGFVAGFGELVGYGLRLVTGRISDRTRSYWSITLIGYGINLLAVPLLALAGSWQVAALLIIMERAGKATRNPARDAMLSHAASQTGPGWGFAMHEALDQTGALIGPLVLALVLYLTGSYKEAFAVLLIPALMALAVLVFGRMTYPNPRDFEMTLPDLEAKLPRSFWLYLAGVGLVAAGYADFPLIAFHFKSAALASDSWTPVLYAVAMGVAGASALLFGYVYDRLGIPTLAAGFLVSAFFPVMVFYGGLPVAAVGIVLWGIGLGAQGSIMKAVVRGMVSSDRRASAFGIFDFGFGVTWFAGSAVMGILYDHSLAALVAFSMAAQILGVVWILILDGRMRSDRTVRATQ